MSIWDFLGGGRNTTEEQPDYYSEGLELASQERFHEAYVTEVIEGRVNDHLTSWS